MLKRSLLSAAAGVLSLLASVTLPASAQNRLPQLIPAASARVTLAHSVSRNVKLSTDLGVASPDKSLSLSLRFNMTPGQTLALQQLLANQQNPSSPQYHQWLTPRQFGAAFGLSSTDLSTVSTWLRTQGFTVTGVANGRTFVTFTGTVAQAEQAFGTSIHSLKYNGEQHIANVTEPTLPSAIAQVVVDITGLNDFRLKPRVHRRTIAASPDLATAKYNGAAAGYGNLLAPGDIYTIYDENSLLSPPTGSAIDGTGVTIAVMGQVDIDSTDITAFRTASGLSTTNVPTQVSEGTTPAAPSAAECAVTNAPSSCDDLYESSLDLEWSGASAPGAKILFVTGEDIFANAMTQAIDQNLAPILTISYGGCEQYFNSSPPTTQTLDLLFMEANAQGQTVVGPGGDTGATDCDEGQGETLATEGLSVDYPASSPYVTGVGGTEFDEGGGSYWNSTNGANAGSAISYIPEQPWNEFFVINGTEIAGLNNGAGGGGVSSLYSKPYWQQGPGVPDDASRDVPDVAYNAAVNHDGYLFCAFGSCSNGGFSETVSGTTYYDVAGGTSFAAPIFAGTLALVEQKIAGKIGNANPTLYGLANNTGYLDSVFHSKTSGGTNASPCQSGSIDCNAGFPNYLAAAAIACPANSCSGSIPLPAIGYVAGSGYTYDTATGWGSVDIANFVNDWSLATPIVATTSSSDNASIVTVATSTPSISAGGQISVAATVASGVSTVTTTPTGTVTLLIDNVIPAGFTPVALAAGAATLTYTTPSTIASGAHTISISYAGDTLFAGSKGATSVDVTAASGGAQDFSITPASASVTVASGGTASPVTYTVTSINGFSGQVTFSATSVALNDAAYSFSVDPVTVTTTTPGTTAITLYAYYNATTGLFKSANVKHLGSGTAHNRLPASPWVVGGTGVALAGLLLFGLPARRRNRWSALLLAAFTVAVLSTSGCVGSSSGSSSGSSNGNVNQSAGTYPVTITATGTSATNATISQSVTLNLIIQ